MVNPTPTNVEMEKIVSLCRRRGFIFPSSEIYGGLSSCWDYGPLGVELKRNIKESWWHDVIQERDDVPPETKAMFKQIYQMQQEMEAGNMPGQK